MHDGQVKGRAHRDHLADFSATRRVIPIAVIASAIGILCTGVAFVLLRMIAFFTNLFYFGRISLDASSPATHHLGVWSIFIPVIGGLIIGALARYGSERIRGHGIPEAIEAILTRGSRVELKVALLKPLSAAVSIGSGGPFGAEGPIIMTGGAFGSLVAQRFHLTSAERKTLLVAGASAGMAAVFGTPVAATLLAVELLLFEWKPRSFIPVALASATAAMIRPFVFDAGPLFPTPPSGTPSTTVLLACLLVGAAAGAVAALMTIAVYAAEDAFPKLPVSWMWWPAIGGLAIGAGGLVAPSALGVGYDVIASLLGGGMAVRAALALLLVKVTIWAISLGSGTSGGVLAPLLMVGAALGVVMTPVLPDAGISFWPLVGMAAILGGAMRVPFTAIVFSLELTHDINMLLPLMIAVVAADLLTVLLLRRSILTEKVDRRGFHVSREYATDPMELLFVREVMSPETDDFPMDLNKRILTYPDEPLTQAVNRMASTGRTELPVVSRDDPTRAVGWVSLENLLEARTRHLEEERERDGMVPLNVWMPSAVGVPRWLLDATGLRRKTARKREK